MRIISAVISLFFASLFFVISLANPITKEENHRETQEVEPRGRPYSYYYLSRISFYIPLYYQLYLAFYYFWVIIRKQIQRKIEAPETRSVRETSEVNSNVISELSRRVSKSIDEFKDKYLRNS